MADADEATTALIARMLAEDQAAAYGADQYGLYMDDSDDSDYGGGRKKKKKAAAPKPAAPRKDPKPRQPKAPKAPKTNDGDQEYTATGRRKRKDAGTARTQARPWTAEEEKLFLEALVLHGRNWKKCAEHVGTRDARSFTSHAQKHFIKLCLQGKRLPPKVAESGEGYTLSGKPLDPNSSAARAYGFKPDSMQKLLAEAMGEEIPGLAVVQDTVEVGKEEQPPAAAAASAPPTDAATEEGEVANPSQEPAAPRAVKAARKAPPAAGDRDKENIDFIQAPAERTEYAKSRPQRRVAERATYKQQTSESLELQALMEFSGPIASGSAGSQPFSVEVHTAARLVMDFHAHLSTHEIIGLLGGVWDVSSKSISVREAFPCRRACGSDSQTSVELDPEHEVETRALMEQRGLVPVGWYHSHPTFAPKPSSKDNSNQHNYQALFRDESSGAEPFVGIIVGPYDMVLPDAASATTVFFVQKKSQGLVAYNIRHTVAPSALPDKNTLQKLKHTTEMFKEDIGRVDFTELWRPFSSLDKGIPAGGPMTKLAKLRNALAVHLPADMFQESEDLLDTVAADIQSIWGLDLGYGK
eukprot:CAMPEP_0117655394 /NCGR_PEP_ID=MMETSP0804-20121206/4255_1 /TAXON_ID=1074897 /ORGANISM="Tetraselmis astigmatica, Strain CCMP880" /LENGTH=582 /DNA_ID=CAMNT_0005461741 /DNA_START=35 /DNA_END=1783 /DNA_ORIENTATION=+